MKSFPASLENLYQMIHYVKEESLAHGFSLEQFHKMEIALEEALVNVIHHGYKDRRDGSIDIHSLTNPNQFHIIIEDDGIAYDPLSSKKFINPIEPVHEREVGGYGIHLITEIMDEVRYERKGEKNSLTLIKHKRQ